MFQTLVCKSGPVMQKSEKKLLKQIFIMVSISPEESLSLDLKASHIEAEIDYQPSTSPCTTEPIAQTNEMVTAWLQTESVFAKHLTDVWAG